MQWLSRGGEGCGQPTDSYVCASPSLPPHTIKHARPPWRSNAPFTKGARIAVRPGKSAAAPVCLAPSRGYVPVRSCSRRRSAVVQVGERRCKA